MISQEIVMDENDISTLGFLQHSRTILVIEEEDETQAFFARALQAEIPYHFLFARDAVKGLAALNSIIPHLLILDSAQPATRGLALYHHLQTQDQFKHLPVLLMGPPASWPGEENLHVPFMSRPFELDALLQKIDEVLAE
jgi:CheY-like chemotaxis protein